MRAEHSPPVHEQSPGPLKQDSGRCVGSARLARLRFSSGSTCLRSRSSGGAIGDEVSSLKWLQRSERNEWVISFANEELQPGAALAEPSMWVQAVPFMS